MTQNKNTYKQFPDAKGYFGQFGGRYVSETLMPLILEVEEEYNKLKNDRDFINDFNYFLKNYVGRPSPLFLQKESPTILKALKFILKETS